MAVSEGGGRSGEGSAMRGKIVALPLSGTVPSNYCEFR